MLSPGILQNVPSQTCLLYTTLNTFLEALQEVLKASLHSPAFLMGLTVAYSLHKSFSTEAFLNAGWTESHDRGRACVGAAKH